VKKSKLMILGSADHNDYMVVRRSGELHITLVSKNSADCMDAICITTKESIWFKESINENGKKLSFTEIGEGVKVEAIEDKKNLSILIAKKEFTKLYFF